VVEQPPDAGGPAVARCGVQRQPFPFGVGFVDGCSGGDELVDDLQPLVVGGKTSARIRLCRVNRASGQPMTSPAARAGIR
jgi:hypothetical protein